MSRRRTVQPCKSCRRNVIVMGFNPCGDCRRTIYASIAATEGRAAAEAWYYDRRGWIVGNVRATGNASGNTPDGRNSVTSDTDQPTTGQ